MVRAWRAAITMDSRACRALRWHSGGRGSKRGSKMASRGNLIVALICLPAFVVIHGAVSYFVFGLAIVSGENGDTSGANTLGILSLIIAPFLLLAYCLPLPLSVAGPVGILCSSLFWWLVGFLCLNYPLPKLEAQHDGK